MRYTVLLLFILITTSFILEKKEKHFSQDVAVIHANSKGLPEGVVEYIQLDKGNPVVSINGKSMKWDGSKWISSKFKFKKEALSAKQLPQGSGAVLSTLTYDNKKIVGCENGLYMQSTSGWQELLPSDLNYSWAPRDVSAIVVDSNENLWIGAEQGVGKFDGKSWKLFTGQEGLLYNNFTCAAAGPKGEVWFGTKKGAIRVENDYFFYRFSRRWLPDDYVNDIAVESNGTVWIATNNGVSQITSVSMTYDEKAEFFTKQTEERHVRMGFIAPNNLKIPYDISSYELGISDNDGMYTSMYGAAQAYRYAVTGDKEAKKLADRSLKACKWLVDITHEPGFPARVIIPIDYREPVNEQYSRGKQ